MVRLDDWVLSWQRRGCGCGPDTCERSGPSRCEDVVLADERSGPDR